MEWELRPLELPLKVTQLRVKGCMGTPLVPGELSPEERGWEQEEKVRLRGRTPG